jgi:leucyl aminopeptidase
MEAGAIIIGQFEGEKAPEGAAAAADKKLGGAIAAMVKQGDIKGKLNEITLIHSLGKLPAGRVAIVGLGKKKELTVNKMSGAFAEALRFLRGKNVSDVASIVLGDGVNDIKAEDAVTTMAEGAILGLYTFKQYMTKKENGNQEIKTITITGQNKSAIEKAIEKGKIVGEAVNWARDMVNEPSNH